MKRSRIRSVSVKKRAADAELAEARAAVQFRSYGRCEANTPACPRREHAGVHCHHVKQRSAGGKHSPENLMLVCEKAHSYIHEHPAESFEKGWLKPSWEN